MHRHKLLKMSRLFILLLLQVVLALSGGSETASPQTQVCPSPGGVPGIPGHNGVPGRDGRDGKDGKDGAVGLKGEKGEPGLSVQGTPGKAGPQGPEGPTGPNGQKGDPGIPGTSDKELISSCQSELSNLKVRLATVEEALSFKLLKITEKVGDKYYISKGHMSTFDEGVKFCAVIGGTLVLPRNEDENKVLTKLIGDLAAPYAYIGANDRAKEGDFVDLNNVPLTFTKWKQGEPNNASGSENCVGLYSSGEWNDFKCDVNRHVICEIQHAKMHETSTWSILLKNYKIN